VITLLCADGIGGNGGPNAMLQNLARPLVESGKYVSEDVMYVASIGPVNRTPSPYDFGPWLKESSQDCAQKLAAAANRVEGKVSIAGYSGGADGASELAEDMEKGEPYALGLREKVLWIVTCANPRRRRGPDAPGWGIAGEHADFPEEIEHFEIANPDDGIPCCPPYSPLRTPTDIGQDPSPQALLKRCYDGAWQTIIPKLPREFSDPLWLWRHSEELPERIKTYQWLLAEAKATKDGWLSAAWYLRGYLDPNVGAHGKQYWEKKLFDPVVEQILDMDFG